MSAHPITGRDARLERLEAWLQADSSVREQARDLALERIRASDGALQAWVEVWNAPSTGAGPLAGIPYGAKDVIETLDRATEYGSPIYRGRRGTFDAAIVRQLRNLGAVLLGKTQTAAFAHRTPPPTRNPRSLEHTPGGSSSGSAAAVAAGMIPFALGTQTLGSVVRPASFCGIAGFKPSHGLVSMEGVLSMSPTLDTLGFFTHTAAGMRLLWTALGHAGDAAEEAPLGVVESPPFVEPEMAHALREAVSFLRSRGMAIREIPIASLIERLAAETRIVMHYQGARFHEVRYRQYGDQLLDLADLVREGLQIPEHRYQEALAAIAQGREEMEELYRRTPVILAPAAAGPAPVGLGSTGDPRINAAWTALGGPAVSIPLPFENGLPLGLQLAAARGQDSLVLQTAERLAELFASVRSAEPEAADR